MKKTAKALVDEAMAQVTTYTVEQALALHGHPGVQFVDVRDIRELEHEGVILRFAAQVATKTNVTAPVLKLSVDHPKEVAVGDKIPLKCIITNRGTGIARKAILRAVWQDGLEHPFSRDQKGHNLVGVHDLDYDIESLAPGESREVTLPLTAMEKGQYTPSVIVVRNDIEEDTVPLNVYVIDSWLSLTREGHAKRFVNRPAESTTKVTNNAAEMMRNVTITEHLPDGVTPIGDPGMGKWNSQARTVTWTIPVLGPGQQQDLKLSVKAERAGSLTGKVVAADRAGHAAELTTLLDVKGFSSLSLDIQGGEDAVTVGDQVSMHVTVKNRGSAPATNVQAKFELPRQMKFNTAKGPATFKQVGQYVTFAALEELEPNAERTYDIVLTAAESGEPNVAVGLTSAERPEPVRQEQAVTITPVSPN